jgi:hypothetical protein
MRPEIALHSCDSNPMYLDFWPLVSKVWRLRMGIEPILIYVDENHDIPIDTTYGRVLKLKPVPGIPTYMNSVWGRFWGATLFPDKVCIVSDIDMFPISKTYFFDQIRNTSSTKYVHLYGPLNRTRPDRFAQQPRVGYFYSSDNIIPVCYHVAKGSVLMSVLRINPNWEQSLRDMASHAYTPREIHGQHETMPSWGIDEDYTTKLINSYPDQNIFSFRARYHARIDRTNWSYTPAEVKLDAYADCHSVRPLSDPANRAKVDALVDLLLSHK